MHETSNRLRLHTVDSAKSIPWPASSAAHSNTSMAACFAPRARSVFRRSLGATYSVGCGPVFGGDRITHRARAAPRPPSRPSLRSRQPWGNEIEKPNKFPDRWWNVVSVAVTLDMEQSKHIGRTGPLLTRTGLVAAFLATAGVVAVERSAHADGIVRCWGYNAQGQCNPPADLGPCSSVAGGGLHTIALRIDGGVRCWGYNSGGQCDPPADLGACSSVAGGGYHTIALRNDGGVQDWGRNNFGQLNTPANLGACSSVAGGIYHTIALRIDGGIRCWGAGLTNTGSFPNYGQCNPPADLGPCSSVAGGLYHTIAIEEACPRCPSSLTGNCIVNGADLGILLNAWGSCPAGTTGCTGDINDDGVVNGADLGTLLGAWGTCPN